jgi:hypothetical protein
VPKLVRVRIDVAHVTPPSVVVKHPPEPIASGLLIKTELELNETIDPVLVVALGAPIEIVAIVHVIASEDVSICSELLGRK